MKLSIQIADHFETLASGKLLAVGLFADRVVVLQVPADAPAPTADAPYATEIGLLITLTDAPATPLQGEVRILPPGGSPAIPVFAFEGLAIRSGQSTNIVTKLKPLLVPAAGFFVVDAQVGDEALQASFEVRVARPPTGTPQTPLATHARAGPSTARRPRKAKP